MDFDAETIKELMDAFDDLYHEIDTSVSRLTGEAGDGDKELHALFRAVHSVKGNAGMLQLKGIVQFTHALEEIASSLREKRYPPSDPICEILHLGMDRVRDLHLRDIAGQPIDNINELELEPLFLKVANADPADVDRISREILSDLGAGGEMEAQDEEAAVRREEQAHEDSDAENSASHEIPNEVEARKDAPLTDEQRHQIYADLNFFQQMALQVDKQSQYWEGRSIQIFEWAQKMNLMANTAIDYDQFAAAIYMHDIGMTFVPHSILNKEGKLTADELDEIRKHPEWGHKLLIHMPHWAEAAQIVLQHQEHFNGKGYPAGLSGEEIHTGARLMAVIDAFFSITNGRADRSQRRSIVRAISEINARSGAQFDPYWVECLNTMIKEQIREGIL